MRYKRQGVAVGVVCLLSIAVAGVMDMHPRVTGRLSESCIASLIRQVPCQEAFPLNMVRYHLDAYRVLVNAVIMAGTALTFGWLLIRVRAWRASVAARDGGVADVGGRPPPGSPFLAIRPWKIQRRLQRWLVLCERGNAAASA